MQLQSSTAHKRRKAVAVDQKKKLPREKLQELRARSGMSTHDIGRAWKQGASSYHKYERAAAQKERPIPPHVVQRLLPLFVGKGQPPITAEEVMELTDFHTVLPRTVVAQYLSPTVDDGKGLLLVRYRVEAGVFVDEADTSRHYGAAIVGVSREYDAGKQFVAVCPDGGGKWYPKGTQLHCVNPTEFAQAALGGRRVIIAVPYKHGDLAQIAMAEVTNAMPDKFAMIGSDGVPVSGKVIGVVIGAYIRE